MPITDPIKRKEYTKLSMKIKRWKEQGKNISDLLYQREQLMGITSENGWKVIPSQNVIPQKQKNDVIPNLNVLNVIPKNEVGNVIPRTKSELVANNVKPENVIPEPEPDKKIEPVKLWSDYYSVKKPTCFNCLKAGIKENEYRFCDNDCLIKHWTIYQGQGKISQPIKKTAVQNSLSSNVFHFSSSRIFPTSCIST